MLKVVFRRAIIIRVVASGPVKPQPQVLEGRSLHRCTGSPPGSGLRRQLVDPLTGFSPSLSSAPPLTAGSRHRNESEEEVIDGGFGFTTRFAMPGGVSVQLYQPHYRRGSG